MIIGIPKEVKNNENRVGMTPDGVASFVANGHEVRVETNAGAGSGFSDYDYEQAGASICAAATAVWAAEMVIKVKEPLVEEYHHLRDGLILYTYLHLAPAKELTQQLLASGTTGVAYETIQLPDRSLPLLVPMSEIAGRMSVQVGAEFLEKTKGGKGILLSGIPGVNRGNVVIIGGGNVGANAAKIACGFGASVTILDVNQQRLAELDIQFGNQIQTLVSNPHTIAEAVKTADLVIGTVLIPGAKAPTLVTEEMIMSMEEGSVIVDVAIDQGGIFETIDKITTHDDPVYIKHGVLHYAVANMPGAVAKTATIGLTNVTLPYALTIANKGLEKALNQDEALQKGVNTYQKQLTNKAVAHSQGVDYTELLTLI
ncbi:alanine dehydrogenase [Vagococcus sp. BWB3-3]|uniref:Alanine dehydrogenase n=1 Tax=Vagococcus allomyrinae TaxID=2794353 RepID=A0A940SVC2_9ENTE|nr:alanine dehydrogenase [Vagococcus allomyrinae]MBP1041699.1 alanine dehydrogenase [Vagococcus allomyrinae]